MRLTLHLQGQECHLNANLFKLLGSAETGTEIVTPSPAAEMC